MIISSPRPQAAEVTPTPPTKFLTDPLVRVYQQDSQDVDADLALLTFGGMQVEPVTEDHAVLAGLLRARHYSFGRSPVILADCTAASVALLTDLPLATTDPHLLVLMAAEGGYTSVAEAITQ